MQNGANPYKGKFSVVDCEKSMPQSFVVGEHKMVRPYVVCMQTGIAPLP